MPRLCVENRMSNSLSIASLLALAVASGCGSNGGTKQKPESPEGQMQSIGAATMKDDGTIVLQLRAESADGAVGDALITYAPSHAKYASVLKHLGGLTPGQSKPVPPWPTRLSVARDGVALGTIEIAAGKPGTLTLTSQSPAATELRSLWDAAVAAGSVQIKMHMPTDDGSRGALGARIYRPKDADYVEGVTTWLRYEEGYQVK